MIRVNVGVSRKLSKNFQSTGFSVNLEGEIRSSVSDPVAVVEEVKQLYDLAEEALGQQIDRCQSEAALASRDENPSSVSAQADRGRNLPPPDPRSAPVRNDNGNGQGQNAVEPATNKQVNYLLTLGQRQGLSTFELERRVTEILGQATGIYALSKRQATEVIDVIKQSPPAASNRN